MDEPNAEWGYDPDVVTYPVEKPGKRAIYYPFDVLEVGKSFTARKKAEALIYSIKRWRGLSDENAFRRFRVKALPEGGCRVWRVK